jgi:putative transposase
MKEALTKKMVRPSQRREMARWAVKARGACIRQACADFSVSETCYRYQRRLSDENAEIGDWLLRLTFNQKNWGFGLCYLYLRNVKRFGWNHKRVYRIYQRAGAEPAHQASEASSAREAATTDRAEIDQPGLVHGLHARSVE